MPFWITLYADDMAVFEDSMQRLEFLHELLQRALQSRGMLMSTPKTKPMGICREQPSNITLRSSQLRLSRRHCSDTLAAYKYTT